MDIRSAARAGDLSALRAAINRGEDVNSVDKDRRTPLSWAAGYDHTDCVRELLSSGATVDLAVKDGRTPLWYAARFGHTDCVRELLSSRAMLDLPAKRGVTPLMEAAYRGHVDVARILLSAGASLHCTSNNGETALMIAERSDESNPETIKLLKEAAEPHPVRILPRNWTVVAGTETEKPVYQNKTRADDTLSTPPGYPLHQTFAHPDVTFYDEPQEKEFTSSGGHADYGNGVEVTVPANAVPAGTSVGIKVQPSLAPKDVFVMPEGIQSASPSYLISGDRLNGEVELSMEHHVRVSTQEEANDLLFLQADSSPKRSGSKSVYEYQEVPEGRSEFTPGGNKGKLTLVTRLKNFFKVGQKKRGATNSNLYTVRVYRSPPQTVEDRMAIIVVSLIGSLYTKFLETLDTVLIPRDYPELSSKSRDRTTLGSLTFVEMCATLNIHPVQGWSVEPDKELISHSEVDQPERENFRPEDLHDYPPRIICRFFPEENAPKRATCTISLSGLLPPVKVHLALKAPTPKVVVDTAKLQTAADELRTTVSRVKCTDSHLSSTVDMVLILMDNLTASLQSSSLSELAAYTDSIRTEIESVLVVARRVADESAKKNSIHANIAKIVALSHWLLSGGQGKVNHCQEQSEETVALRLVDLVENGANLLRSVDSLLKDIYPLSRFSGSGLAETINIEHPLLNKEIETTELAYLAIHFDDVVNYMEALGLTPAEQTDVKTYQYVHSTQAAMIKCLSLWQGRDPAAATYRALVKLLQKMRKYDIASKVFKHCKEARELILSE